MEKYDNMVRVVSQTLEKLNYTESTIRYHLRCYDGLRCYLENSCMIYSPECADNWFLSIRDVISSTALPMFKSALLKLRDVYLYDRVLLEHIPINLYRFLSECNREIVDCYRLKLLSEATDKICSLYINKVTAFLYFTESEGCISYLDLSYAMIRRFYQRTTEKAMYMKQREDRIVYHFLLWLHKSGSCTYGFSITMHYMLTDSGKTSWLIVPDEVFSHMLDLNEDALERTGEIPGLIEEIVSDLKEHNYSKDSISSYRRVLEWFYLFLDENKLNYSLDIAGLWISNVDIDFKRAGHIERRALRILDEKIRRVEVDYARIYRYQPTKIDKLPDWCRSIVVQFLELKKAEGMKYSTVAMYRSSIIRVCHFLDARGISSFSDVRSEDIKAFHKQDFHKTPEGKNAYNTRIRKFLKYLGEEGIIPNLFLYLSVPCEAVNSEYIVITLTEDEKDLLHSQLRSDDLSLRDKAVLLLGYRLGIRGSDIVDLEINSIDWNNSTIRFIQNKTSTEMVLPLTPDVGNALYRYIMEERPDTNMTKVFIRERAPFTAVTRSICRRTMNRTFPDRNIPGSDFHVLRKTMATEVLQTGISAQTVSNLLGHANNATVMKYLSLDEIRMRKCAISLKESSLEYGEESDHA